MSILSKAVPLTGPGLIALLADAPRWAVCTTCVAGLVLLVLPCVDRALAWREGRPRRERQQLVTDTLRLISDPERRLHLLHLFEPDTTALPGQPRPPVQDGDPPTPPNPPHPPPAGPAP